MPTRFPWLGRHLGNLTLTSHFRPASLPKLLTAPSGFSLSARPRRLDATTSARTKDHTNLLWLRCRGTQHLSCNNRSVVIVLPPKDTSARTLLSDHTFFRHMSQRYPQCDVLLMDYTHPGQTPTSLQTLARATQATLHQVQRWGYQPHNTHLLGYSMGNAAMILALTTPPPTDGSFKTSGLGVLSVSGFGSLEAAFLDMISRVSWSKGERADQPTWLGRCLRALVAPLVHDLLTWGGWGDNLAWSWHDLPDTIRLEGVMHCKQDRVVSLPASLLEQRHRPRRYTAYGLRRLLTAVVVLLCLPLILLALTFLAVHRARTLRDLQHIQATAGHHEQELADTRSMQHQLGSVAALLCMSVVWALLQPFHPEVWGTCFLPGNRLIAAKHRGAGTRFLINFVAASTVPVTFGLLIMNLHYHGLHQRPWLLVSMALIWLTLEAGRVLCVSPRRQAPSTLRPGPESVWKQKATDAPSLSEHHCILSEPCSTYTIPPMGPRQADSTQHLVLVPRAFSSDAP